MCIHPIGASLSVALLALAGIAVAEPERDAQPPAAAAAEQAPARHAPEAAGETTETPASPHRVELTPDLVYAVLVGEIAVQRGDNRMAFTHYLQAARLARDPELAELAARAALSLSDPAAATRATDLWVELAPDSAKARQIAAYAKIDAGDRAAALADLRELVRLAPNRGQGYMQAAQMLTRLSDSAERLSMMNELVAGDEDDADAQFALANLAAAADDLHAARAHAERAAELRPHWNSPRTFLVRLLVSEDRRDEAVSVLDGYLAAEPDDQELQLLRAQLYMEAEDYDAALALFDKMLAAGPGQPDVLFAAAVLSMQAKAWDRARDYLNRLRETGSRDDDAAFLLGQVEESAGNQDLALDWYAKVDGENATNAQVRIAGIYADRGEMPRAREILQQLRDQYPTDATTFYLIEGQLLKEHDQKQEAMDVYTSALTAKPDDADLLYARAMLAVGIGQVDILERDLRQILVSDPDHVDALNALGYTLADRTDRLDEAFSLIQRAIQLSPDEPAILDSMGWVLYRKGNAAAAEPYLRKALDAAFDPEIAAHLGEVLWALGKRDEARKVWEHALAEDPKHEYLLRVVGRHPLSQNETH